MDFCKQKILWRPAEMPLEEDIKTLWISSKIISILNYAYIL